MTTAPPLSDLLPLAGQITKNVFGVVHQPTAALLAVLLPEAIAAFGASALVEVEAAVRDAGWEAKTAFRAQPDPLVVAILTVATLRHRVAAALQGKHAKTDEADTAVEASEAGNETPRVDEAPMATPPEPELRAAPTKPKRTRKPKEATPAAEQAAPAPVDAAEQE